MNGIIIMRTAAGRGWRPGGFLLPALLLLMACLICFQPTSEARAASLGDAIFTVHQSFTEKGSSGPSDVFSYKLTRTSATNPMPAGSSGGDYRFTVAGTAKITLPPINFASPGVYSYMLTHTTRTAEGYSCDTKSYTIDAYVKSDLTASLVVLGPGGAKASGLRFSHIYKAPASPAATPPKISPGGGSPAATPSKISPGGGSPAATPPKISYGGGPVTETKPAAPAYPNPGSEATPSQGELPSESGDGEPSGEARDRAGDGQTGGGLGIIGGEPAPLAGGGAWSLFNLICVILTAAAFAFGFVWMIARRKRGREDDGEESLYTRLVFLALSLVAAIANLILFVKTQALWLTMIIFDKWSILSAVLLAAGIILARLTFRKERAEERVETE